MTDQVEPQAPLDQAPPVAAEQDKPAYIDQLRQVAAGLTSSDIPSGAEAHSVLGAVVKLLEHQGVTIADELLAPSAPAPAAPGAPAAPVKDPKVDEHEDRLGRIEAALERVVDRLSGSGPAAP